MARSGDVVNRASASGSIILSLPARFDTEPNRATALRRARELDDAFVSSDRRAHGKPLHAAFTFVPRPLQLTRLSPLCPWVAYCHEIMHRVPIVALGIASFVAGCSLLTSLDGLGSSDGGGDSHASDGSADSGGDGGNGNLLTNPSFELGSGGCGTGWGNGYGMTFTRVSPGRTGSYACLVCVLPNQTDSYELDSLIPVPAQAGSYYAEAWLSTPEGGVATQAGVQGLYAGDGGISSCIGTSTICQGTFFPPPVGTWSLSSATFTVTASGTIAVNVHSYAAPAGSCFVVDDLALYAQ